MKYAVFDAAGLPTAFYSDDVNGTVIPAAAVDRERQRRVIAGKTINGVAVTGRDEDARNLTHLALAAKLRIGSGDTTITTTFRDGNIVDHDLTPPEMLALWQGSAAYVSALYEASWALKAMEPIRRIMPTTRTGQRSEQKSPAAFFWRGYRGVWAAAGPTLSAMRY